MILTGQCACGQKVEFEAEELSQLNCPSCGRPLHEQFGPPPPSTPKPRFDPPPDPNEHRAKLDADIARVLQGTDRDKVLKAVREKSCYGALRGLINTVIFIGIALVALAMLGDVLMMSQRGNDDFIVRDVGVLAFGAIMIVLMVALRQALFLAIDAVDIMIADRSDRLANFIQHSTPVGAYTFDK